MAKIKTNQIEETPTSTSIRRRRLFWGQSKTQLATLITPFAHDLLREKASQFHLSKSDLLEYLSRCLDDPAVEEAIKRQIRD